MIFVAVSSPYGAAQAQEGLLGNKEFKFLIANARTSEDHQKLARHFAVKAESLEAESQEHERLAAQYRRIRGENPAEMKAPMSPRTAAHCEYFADQTRKAAQKARLLAEHQEASARQAAR